MPNISVLFGCFETSDLVTALAADDPEALLTAGCGLTFRRWTKRLLNGKAALEPAFEPQEPGVAANLFENTIAFVQPSQG